MRIILEMNIPGIYTGFHDGKLHQVTRERGLTPNGNQVNRRWVYRIDGIWIDFDTYRSDLGERNGFELVENTGTNESP